MIKPTPLAKSCPDLIMLAAAKQFLRDVDNDCLCDDQPTIKDACFFCEVRAVIKQLEEKRKKDLGL